MLELEIALIAATLPPPAAAAAPTTPATSSSSAPDASAAAAAATTAAGLPLEVARVPTNNVEGRFQQLCVDAEARLARLTAAESEFAGLGEVAVREQPPLARFANDSR